jgi:inorganic pyrophosphatase
MRFKVFIENEAGSTLKNHHNERTLTFEHSESVACPYPFPYGFIIDTVNADGDCLDCFVITDRKLHTAEVVECEAIGLMEQIEDGLPDNNVLARLLDEQAAVTREVEDVLGDFVRNVFSHLPGTKVSVGRFLGAGEALSEITVTRLAKER